MLQFILPMFPFLLPLLLGVILVYGLWIHDVSYRHQEVRAGKANTFVEGRRKDTPDDNYRPIFRASE
jgi:hypothetical protein